MYLVDGLFSDQSMTFMEGYKWWSLSKIGFVCEKRELTVAIGIDFECPRTDIDTDDYLHFCL